MNVTLRNGRIASKEAVDEIFCRVHQATGNGGVLAVEKLAQLAFGFTESITNLEQASRLHKHGLILSAKVPVTKEQIVDGPNGLTAHVVTLSVRSEMGSFNLKRPYREPN